MENSPISAKTPVRTSLVTEYISERTPCACDPAFPPIYAATAARSLCNASMERNSSIGVESMVSFKSLLLKLMPSRTRDVIIEANKSRAAFGKNGLLLFFSMRSAKSDLQIS